MSADRITPDWKITLGSEFDHETEEFDLDEENPVKVHRRERDFNWLVVKGLGEHWSIGALGDIESSTFENTQAVGRGGARPRVQRVSVLGVHAPAASGAVPRSALSGCATTK